MTISRNENEEIVTTRSFATGVAESSFPGTISQLSPLRGSVASAAFRKARSRLCLL